MRTSRLLALLALSFLQPTLAPTAHAQDTADPAQQVEKFERYLERKPYHEWAFDQMLDAAVKSNAVQTLIDRYEARSQQGGTLAERVVYARLLARVDRVDEALELLRSLEDPPAALWQLVGGLELRRGAPAAAVEALDRAVAATTARQELEALHRLRGEAYLAAGDSPRATTAFRALAALDPEDFQLRLEAASALARYGLTEPALTEFDAAKRLAGDDTARRCRVLSEIGRLHEQLAQGDAALAVYAEAIGLMGRGNWLKRDLADRVVALHRRNKSIPALVERAAEAADAAPGDLDAQEFYARALGEVGDQQEAIAVLTRATVAFPSDVPLARARIERLRDADDMPGVIAEYQRILGERPNELDLYLELGQAFAAGGQLDQAKRQWQKTLDERLDDPGLAARLAALYALYGETDDAIAMYEKAIALEPREIVRYSDLASYLKATGRNEAITAALERAERIADGDAGKLDEVAVLWREFDAPERARATLERALALAPDDVKLVRRYADVQLDSGDLEGGTETLRRVLALARDSGTRRSAIDRALQGWWRAGREQELLERVAASDSLADRLMHGRLLVRRRDPAGALAAYEALVATAPELEEAREALAKLLEEAGELELALAQYDALIELRPQNRRKYLKDIAAIHLERYDQDAAFQCYDEILASSPDNAAAFREVARAYEQLGLVDQAIECYLQAVRLEPTDGRTRLDLAELFRATGEWDRGEREIVAAFGAKDDSSRKRARETYHALLAQEGRISTEMAALRERIAQNPYDAEAPVTLTDLYVRELEYELALEMLDDLIAYQPNEPRLLRERARVLGFLERHGESIDVYESLWKLPDADQRALALDIADAHIKRGERAKAEEILTQMGDPDALARAYERNDLMELAIETLEQSLQRRPNDQRLLDRLARLQERVRDRAGAIATVERLAELTGESWRGLKRLGELYHAAGRREDALAIGERLFALVRIEDTPEPPRDDEEPEKGKRRAAPSLTRSLSTGRANAYDQRIDELQQWYGTIEAPSEFADVAARELRRQPTNDKLLMSLVNAWQREEGKAAALAEALAAVRAGTLDVGRTPAGRTTEQWARTLDGYVGRLATRDAPWGRERVKTLRAEVTATPDAARSLELADLLVDLGEPEGALEVLRAGVDAFQEDVFLRTGLASQLQRERQFTEAAEHWRAVLAALLAAGATNDAPAEERELAYRSGRTALLRGFPIHMQRRLSEEELRRHDRLTYRPVLSSSWALGSLTPTPGGVRMALARCLHDGGDDAAAKAEIAALATELGVTADGPGGSDGPEGADSSGGSEGPEANAPAAPSASPPTPPDALILTSLSTLASLNASLDFDADAQALIERLARVEAALEVHPLHGFNRTWASSARGSRKELAKILERGDDHLGAYDVLREYGANDEAKLLLEERKLHEQAITWYEGRAEAAMADLASWRDEMVKLAEVQQHARRFDACLATYSAIAARDPEDFAVRDAIAKLHERAQRWEDALGAHESIVAAKRAANRRATRQAVPVAPKLAPIDIPRAEGDNSWAWDNLRNAGRWGSGPGSGKHSVMEHYAAILKLLLDQREIERATEVMLQIAREDARNMSWLGYSLGEILQEYRLEAAGVPIMRLLHSYNDTNESLSLNYGAALMAAKRFDEARRVFRALLDGTGTQSYYRDEASRQLAVAEKRLGLDSKEDRADLEAKVAADPKNAKARIALAQRLLADEEDAAALEHALAAEAVAPHLEEVRALVQRLLQINGRHAELEERLIARVDDLTDEDALARAAWQIADWMAARGDDAAVEALFERVRRKAGGRFRNASPADWYSKRGDIARALAELQLDLDKADPWYKTQIRQKQANLRMQLGDPRAVLESTWEEFAKATAKGDKDTILSKLVASLMRYQHEPATLAELERSALAHEGDDARLRTELELAALQAVRGDARGAEERAHALAASDRAYSFLYPTLVDLARARKDLAQALAYLEELHGLGLASESSMVSTSIGNLAEADALRAEIGCLRLELEDRAGADEIWGTMFEPDDQQGMQALAALYAEVKLWPEALASQRAYIAKAGARDQTSQRALADLLYEVGEVDEALATFERLLILVEDDEYQRNEVAPRVMRLYRESGRLDARREQLRARLASDSDDVRGALELAKLEAEAGDEERARQLLVQVAERPDQLEQTAPVLIGAARARGDLDDACQWYEKLLAGNSEEWTRRNYATEYGKILIERGEVERAVEVVLGCYPDAESEEALGAALSLLTEQRQFERALALLPQITAVSAKPENQLHQHVEILKGLERDDEALATIGAALADPKQRKAWMFAWYASEDQEGHELERVTAALAEAPDDEGLMTRWVALVSGKEEHSERCVELLQRLHAAQPRDVELRKLLVNALTASARQAEALPHIEALLERLDRDRARDQGDNSWESRNAISSLRSQRGIAAYEAHGADAALAAQLDGAGLRYAASDRYSSDNTRLSTKRFNALHSLGLDDRLLEEYAALPPGERSQAGSHVEQRVRALRYRAGEREAVLEELYRRAFEGASDPFAKARSANNYVDYDPFGMPYYYENNNQGVSSLARELTTYFHEEDRLAELRARVEPLATASPEDSALKAALKHIDRLIASDSGEDVAALDARERKERELEAARKRVEEDAFDPQRLVALARILLRSNESVEALELLERATPMVRGSAYSAVQESIVVRSQRYGVQGGMRFRFASSSGVSSGSSYSSWSSSSNSAQQEHLRLLAAAHFANGDREAGLACEERLERLGATSDDGWVYDPFTRTWSRGSQTIPLYIALGLDDEVERVAELELGKIARECAGDPTRERQRQNELADQILNGYTERKDRPVDEARRARWVELRRAGWEASIAEAPQQQWRVSGYLDWLRRVAKDEDTWRSYATDLVARPAWQDQKPTLADGWLLLRLDDVAGARARFEAVGAKRTRAASRAVVDEVEVGLALCRHREGDAEGARPVLRRALAHGSSSADPALMRRALGLPELP